MSLHRFDRLDDLGFCRKTAGLAFGEDLPVVGRNDEDAAAAADELGLEAGLLPDLGRQTGSPGKVVSNAAVVDSNVHEQ